MDRFEEGGRIEQTNQVQISEPNQQVVTAEPQAQNAYSQIANNSPQVQQMRSFSAIANQSPYAQKLTQLHAIANGSGGQNPSPIQQPKNETGLPDRLKSGIENLGGYSMDDVRVHYNSSKPAQLQAHAYAQGTEIHIAPGQEKHLPHEAWHVVQQKQGRVKPTLQMKGIAINDDSALEKEADVMGAKAWGMGGSGIGGLVSKNPLPIYTNFPFQRKVIFDGKEEKSSQLMKFLLTYRAFGELPNIRRGLILEHFPNILEAAVKDKEVVKSLNSNEELLDWAIESTNPLLMQSAMEIVDLGSNRKASQWILNHGIPALISAKGNDHLEDQGWLNWLKSIHDLIAKLSVKDVRSYVATQSELQQLVAKDLAAFRGFFTTVGFEFEFAQSEKGGPLSGVSHLELARTDQLMPITKLPFLIETDASNAIELVTPPFLFPVENGNPLPDGDEIEAVDKMFKDGLSNAPSPQNKKGALLARVDAKQTFSGMINAIEKLIGIKFIFNEKIEILFENLSPNIVPDALRGILEQRADEKGLVVDKRKLEEIKVKEIVKGGKGVSSHVNVALDFASYAKILELQQSRSPIEKGVPLFSDLKLYLMGCFEQTVFPANLGSFVRLIVEKLIGLPSVFYQLKLREMQRIWMQQLKESSEVKIDKQDYYAPATMSSKVKDSGSVWAKDHLLSLLQHALGTIEDAEQRVEVRAQLADVLKSGKKKIELAKIKEILSQLLVVGYQSPPWNTLRLDDLDGLMTDFEQRLNNSLDTLIGALESDAFIASQPSRELYGHSDDRIIGAREDTYLDSQAVNKPSFFGDRLFVAEFRTQDAPTLIKSLGT